MVIKENEQIHRICIYQILSKIIVKTIYSAVPVSCFFVKGFVHLFHQREIHHGTEIGVSGSSQSAVFLPERNQHITVQPSFTYYVEIRVLIGHGFTPF